MLQCAFTQVELLPDTLHSWLPAVVSLRGFFCLQAFAICVPVFIIPTCPELAITSFKLDNTRNCNVFFVWHINHTTTVRLMGDYGNGEEGERFQETY